MHAARLERSPRLRRVLAVLTQVGWHSTRDIMREANVCAVSACISELRANGFRIDSTLTYDRVRGARVWRYRLAPAENE